MYNSFLEKNKKTLLMESVVPGDFRLAMTVNYLAKTVTGFADQGS
jgi:hypothetical protein